MRQSQLFGTTRREAPRDEESRNAIILTRGAYVQKTMAGVYSYLPLGLRVLHNISAIVREEMNTLPGVQEVLLPALQPRELWEETNRWNEAVGNIMYTLADDTVGLGPTHEEVATDVFRGHISSYKQLPAAFYQIQTKYRRELRAKSGLLRGREFLMKDLYSFSLSEEDFDGFYTQVRDAYLRVFKRCGLNAILTLASGGMFSKYSEEFQVIADAGEDTIYLNAAGTEAKNKEIVTDEADPELLTFSGGHVRTASSIEVGNIFRLGRRFSTPMHASVSTEAGESVDVWTGSYGIGISRLIGTVVEVLSETDSKMVWPEELAPFKVHLIDLTSDAQGEAVYADLQKAGFDVLFDDRAKMAGEKFADADLIGSPTRLVISKRSLAAGGIEMVKTGESSVVAVGELISRLSK